MAALPGFLLIFIALLSSAGFAPLARPGYAPTPPPPQVCAKVDRLNVRAGPGTQYAVVAGMVYGQCAERLEVSADQAWVRVEQGWVSAQFVETRQGILAPTPAALPAATLRPSPSAAQAATRAATASPTDTAPPEARTGIKVPGLPDFLSLPALPDLAFLRDWALANPLRALILLLTFYVGLVSVQKFGPGRLVLNGVLALLMAAATVLVWDQYLGRVFVETRVRLAAPTLAGQLAAGLGGYGGGLLLGGLVYRRPRSTERGADTPCCVCGQKQRRTRMKVCPNCQQPYCDFPAWQHTSLRAAVDHIALWIAIPLGFILTAVSIVGGILVLAVLSVPYLLLRELLPENRQPPYWKNCGSLGYCRACAVKLFPAPAPTYPQSSSSSDSSWGSDSSSSDDWSDRDTSSSDRDDDDDDDKKGGSFFDGWLVKYR